MNNIQLEIIKLRNMINKQNNEYFNKNNNEITDELYDQLLNKLKMLEEKYPQYNDINSPTVNIGENVENTFDKVTHTIKMLSLDKVLTFDSFVEWLKKMVNNNVYDFNFQYKFDGLANELIYKNGKLIQGSTRGNGTVGADNTATVKLIPNIPQYLSNNDFKNNEVKITGEVILLKEGFNKINETLSDDLKYQNVRNAASGILKNKVPNKDFVKYLRFMPYGLYVNDKLIGNSYSEVTNKINFKDTYVDLLNIKIDKLSDNIINYLKTVFEQCYNNRDNLPFDIDGIVIKANDYNDWERLGVGKKHPHYAIAYKFPAKEAVTKLEDIEWLLGGKGTITPRAKIQPVEIGGTTITSPTLHNIEIIKKLDLKIGDYVVVSRHGDVIPEIDRVLIEMRDGTEKDIIYPEICPVCGKPLNKKGKFIRCDNVYCEGRKLSKIENFIKAMEIDNFGPSLIEKLYNNEFIHDFTDIYNLKIEDLSQLDKMGVKSATKVINNVENSKNNTLDKIINGLMIPNVSIEKAKILMDKYKTLDGFIKCNYNELINLPTFGDIITNNILEYLKDNNHIKLINKLIELNIIGKQNVSSNNTKLNNQSFCFTGKLSISRNEMEKMIADNGGVVNSIKKGTDYLIIGEGAKEHKIDKAKNYGIKVITENEFYNLIN